MLGDRTDRVDVELQLHIFLGSKIMSEVVVGNLGHLEQSVLLCGRIIMHAPSFILLLVVKWCIALLASH